MPANPVNVTLTEEVYYLLGSPAAPSVTQNEQSNILRVDRYLNHAYQILTEESAEVRINVSLDGVTWFTLDTKTVNHFAQVNGLIRYVQAVRGNTTDAVKVIWASRSFYEG